MLTETQRTQFRQAVDFWNGDKDGILEMPIIDSNDAVVETIESITDFVKNLSYQNRYEEKTKYGELVVFEKAQAQKGQTRSTVLIMDFGSARAAYNF